MTNMSPEMSAPLPATLVDKRPWPPPLKDSNSLLTDTCLLCLHSGHPFSSGQIDALLRQPRPPPLLLDLMDPDGLLKSIPWPSLCESVSVVHLQNSLALVLAISFTTVQTLSVWQEVSGRALDSITLLPTLCSCASDGLYQLKTVISYTNSYMLLFSFSQYASLLLHSSHCYHQPVQWKPPCISMVYIFSNRPYIASLRIRTSMVPHLFWWPVFAKLKFWDVQYKIFCGKVMGQCFYIIYLGLHHDSIIPRIISPVSTLSGKRCYRRFWKPPWASSVCKVITWKFLARLRNLQSSETMVAMFLGLTRIKSVL